MKDEELADNWIAEYTRVDVETQKAIQLQYHKNLKQAFLAGAKSREKRIAELEAQIEKMKCCGNCGNERCTSKYRGNSAYHRQSDGYACADNEDWEIREK
jgi:hypothetical protein